MDTSITPYSTICELCMGDWCIVEVTTMFVLCRDAIRYSFGPVIQKQLLNLVWEWNHHRIRNTVTAEAPGGIPEVLYHLPAVGSSGKVIIHVYKNPLSQFSLECLCGLLGLHFLSSLPLPLAMFIIIIASVLYICSITQLIISG